MLISVRFMLFSAFYADQVNYKNRAFNTYHQLKAVWCLSACLMLISRTIRLFNAYHCGQNLKSFISNRPLFRQRSVQLEFFVPAKCKTRHFRYISLMWVNTNTLTWELICTVTWLNTTTLTWELNRYRPDRTGQHQRTTMRNILIFYLVCASFILVLAVQILHTD